ncbi:MAG: 50S ribosomal protein L9 [Thermodesulfobacteriota bacterium]
MKVILKQTIESLGIIGSEVDVKKGHARNYLIPQGKAVEANAHNRKQMEQERKKIELQLAKEREMAEQIAARLDGVSCQIPAKVADENRLYGSVSAKDIAEALEQQGVEVQKRMILLPDPIKHLGTYQVPIRVYKDIEPEITVEVVPEQ